MGSAHLMLSYIVTLRWSKGSTSPRGSLLVALHIDAHISGRGWMPNVGGSPAPRAPPVPTPVVTSVKRNMSTLSPLVQAESRENFCVPILIGDKYL